MADPLLDGSVQVSVTVPLLLVLAETPVGAPGDVAGVTELEAPDGGPVPTPLMAATVKV